MSRLFLEEEEKKDEEMETDQLEETVVTSGELERDGTPTGNPVSNPEKFKVEEEKVEKEEVIETDQVEVAVETSGSPERDGQHMGNPLSDPVKFKVSKLKVDGKAKAPFWRRPWLLVNRCSLGHQQFRSPWRR